MRRTIVRLAAPAMLLLAAGAAAAQSTGSEHHFDGNLQPVQGSGPAVMAYLDDIRFADEGVCTQSLGLPIEGLTAQQYAFGTASQFGIPNINGQPTTVLRVSPPRDARDDSINDAIGLLVWPRTGPQCNGDANTFTMIWDLYIPQESWDRGGVLVPLLNDNDNNSNGVDMAIGIDTKFGQGPGLAYRSDPLFTDLLQPETWLRVAFVVDPNGSRVFINGQFVGTSGNDWIYNNTDPDDPRYNDEDCEFSEFRTPVDSDDWMRWGMFPNPWVSNGDCGGGFPEWFDTTYTIFADNGGNGELFYCAAYSWIQEALSDDDIIALGSPDAAGIRFTKGGEDCPIDYDGNGQADGGDFLAFLGYFFSGDNRADLDGNNIIDGADFLTFLALFFSDDCQP